MKKETVLITGGASGIGESCAIKFSNLGYKVIVVDKCENKKLKNFDVDQINLDISSIEAIDYLFDEISHKNTPVDILINNAGISPKKNGVSDNVVDIDLSEWNKVISINLTAPMLLSSKFLPYMIEANWGRIINVSSMAARTAAMVAGCSYICTKSGLNGLTKHIAAKYGKYGVTANSVAPGRIITPMTNETSNLYKLKYIERNPIGREGEVNEVASAIIFLASKESSYINGVCLDVNGGMFMV